MCFMMTCGLHFATMKSPMYVLVNTYFLQDAYSSCKCKPKRFHPVLNCAWAEVLFPEVSLRMGAGGQEYRSTGQPGSSDHCIWHMPPPPLPLPLPPQAGQEHIKLADGHFSQQGGMTLLAGRHCHLRSEGDIIFSHSASCVASSAPHERSPAQT